MFYQSRCRNCGHKAAYHWGEGQKGSINTCPVDRNPDDPPSFYAPKDNLEYCIWLQERREHEIQK